MNCMAPGDVVGGDKYNVLPYCLCHKYGVWLEWEMISLSTILIQYSQKYHIII